MKTSVFFYLIAFLFFNSCDIVEDDKFVIDNKRSVAIDYYFSSDSTEATACDFFSSSYYTQNDRKFKKEFEYIGKNKIKKIPLFTTWENQIRNNFKNGIGYLYIIDSSNIGRSCEEMKTQKLLNRYRITVDSMEKIKWIIEVK